MSRSYEIFFNHKLADIVNTSSTLILFAIKDTHDFPFCHSCKTIKGIFVLASVASGMPSGPNLKVQINISYFLWITFVYIELSATTLEDIIFSMYLTPSHSERVPNLQREVCRSFVSVTHENTSNWIGLGQQMQLSAFSVFVKCSLYQVILQIFFSC